MNQTPTSSQTLEALERIEDIHRILSADHRVLFSGKKMMAIGALLCVSPFIEISTRYFTFGTEALKE